jgi:hypothetical protein
LLDLLDTLGEVERWVSVCFVAGRSVTIDPDELNSALRRAVVVRAVGGDPHRELTIDEDAVVRLAEELDGTERREQLQLGLASLRDLGRGRPDVEETIVTLIAAPDLSWRAFCAGLLADELAD